MIHIDVLKKNVDYVRFSSKGHAGYAEAGEDIVCAAVSALVINTVNSLEKFTEEKFRLKEGDGLVSVVFEGKMTGKGRLLMDSLLLGLTEIESDYNNQYLRVNIEEV